MSMLNYTVFLYSVEVLSMFVFFFLLLFNSQAVA